MQSFNVSASGQLLYVNFNTDISLATNFSLRMVPKRGLAIEVTPELGTADIWVGDERFITNNYVKYVIQPNQWSLGSVIEVDNVNDQRVDGIGLWRVKAGATLGDEVIFTNFMNIRVMS
jgi:hypothetical protein